MACVLGLLEAICGQKSLERQEQWLFSSWGPGYLGRKVGAEKAAGACEQL